MRPEVLEFLNQSQNFEARGLRILLEYFHANEKFRGFYSDKGVHGVSVFGSARVTEGHAAYEAARQVGHLLYEHGFAVVTGAAGGVMEAANRGVAEAILARRLNGKRGSRDEENAVRESEAYHAELARHSIGLKITLPWEKESNPFVGNGVRFHYFAIRKMFFAMLSEAFIACDGGWGTQDEFWEIATLVQTGKAPLMPIVVLSSEEEHLRGQLQRQVEQGYISPEDLHLIDFVETPGEAAAIVAGYYRVVQSVRYERGENVVVKVREPVGLATCEAARAFAKEHAGLCDELLFSEEHVILRGHRLRSYGPLRRFIDVLNGEAGAPRKITRRKAEARKKTTRTKS